MAAVLAPLVKGSGRIVAVRDSIIFGLAGAVASVGLGYVLGSIGRMVLANGAGVPLVGLLVIVLALVRELGVAQIPLPQLRRVSDRRWAMTFPRGVATALWGLDIGLFVTTRISLLGAWIVPLACVGLRDPLVSAALFGAYWLGRFASSVLTPLLIRRHDAVELLAELDAKQTTFRLTYRVGLAAAAAVFCVMAVT